MARAKAAPEQLSSRHPLVRRVERYLGQHDLLARGDRVLAAISGGADSVFLLRALVALAKPRGFSVEVAHFNHRWRGDESDADARFVAALADALGVPFHAGSASGSKPRKLSPEEAARNDRYRFLAQVARSRNAVVATGHTLDDQLETYLIGWLRGSGPAGASLMAPSGGVPAPRAEGLRAIRPLLLLGREEIRRTLAASGHSWREDRTNDDPRYLRNRVRAELIPLMESLVPGARKAVLRTAALSRDAATLQQRSASAEATSLLRADGDALVADRTSFLALSPVIRAPVLLTAVARLVGSATDVESNHLFAAIELIARGRGAKRTPLGPHAQLRLDRGQIRIIRRGETG